jgi:hypothetical protein
MQENSFTCPKSQNKNNLILLLQHPSQEGAAKVTSADYLVKKVT